MPTLELKSITAFHPNSSTPAVVDVTCSLESGRLIILRGPNGSGKSSLAQVIAGVLPPSSGELLIDGERLNAKRWNGIGYLFQNPDEQLLAPSVEAELAWGLENLAIPAPEMWRRMDDTLGYFDLRELRRRSPESLSDGQKQLVALAAVTVMEPQFLILDEVTAYLDPWWSEKIRHYVQRLAQRCGVLWITARRRETITADEVWVMDKGRLEPVTG